MTTKFDYNDLATQTDMQELKYKCGIDDKGCWVWDGHVNDSGYAIVWIDKVKLRAHRIAYILVNGPVAEDLDIDHGCENRRCINPAHLEAVTHQLELAFGKKGTECAKGHGPLSLRPADGWLYCKVCNNAYQRKMNARKALRRYY